MSTTYFSYQFPLFLFLSFSLVENIKFLSEKYFTRKKIMENKKNYGSEKNKTMKKYQTVQMKWKNIQKEKTGLPLSGHVICWIMKNFK